MHTTLCDINQINKRPGNSIVIWLLSFSYAEIILSFSYAGYMKIAFLYCSIWHWCMWMTNQIFSEHHFISPLSALHIVLSWNLKKNFGDQNNYSNKTPHLSMSTVHRACNSFPWHRDEYGLQTPSISIDQNLHRRPMGKQGKLRQHMELTQDGCWFQFCVD